MNLSILLSLFEMKVSYPLRFAVYKAMYKQDKNRILFADPYATDLTDNMKPVYAALSEKDGITLVKCFPQTGGLQGNSLAGKLKGRANRSAAFGKFLKEYARCGVVFLTESYLPAYAVKPRPGTQVVQLWHGSGAFKKWGYSTLDKSFGASDNTVPMHNCYTLVPVSSPVVSPCYAEAFRCDPGIIKPLGVPRTDELVNSSADAKAELIAAHPELAGKKLILYAPTFRGNNVVNAKSGVLLELSKFDSDCAILLRLHPFARGKYEIPTDCKGIILDTSEYPTNFCLRAADVLVTDYSSIIFEYSLLEKPMIFFAPDLEEYKSNRDFYYGYEGFVPGPITKTTDEVIEIINSDSFDLSAPREFKKKYMSACDGHAAEKILKELLD